MKKKKEIGVSEFKAKALGYFEETAKTGAEFIILKKGKPIAKVIPFKPPLQTGSSYGSLKGLITIPDDVDLVHIDFSDEWDALK